MTEWHSQISSWTQSFTTPPLFFLRLWFIHTTCCTMGALFAKWDSLNGDLYFQDYICIQLQMMWRGEAKGSRFNTLPLSMNNSIIWIKWTPGAVGKALRRAVDPLTLPTSPFPSLSLSVPLSLQFHSTLYKMPYTCNFSLPSAKNLLSLERQRRGKKCLSGGRGRNSYQSF